MNRLEIVKIGNTPIFSRENTTHYEANDIIDLQGRVHKLVNEVRRAENKKEFADERISWLLELFAFLNDRFEGLEQSIRQLARELW